MHLNIIDAENGRVLWKSETWELDPLNEKQVHFPKELLKCKEVAREITFSSKEEIKEFQLLQKISLNGQEIEQLYFKFGFVIPTSTNSWE